MFEITEDNLTNAIFNNSALVATGSGTKAEARAQARKMLAAIDLLTACEQAYPLLTADGSGHITPENSLAECDRVAKIVRAAIHKAGVSEALTGDVVRLWKSCSWCHTMNESTERSCKQCGHDAQVCRLECRCPQCERQRAAYVAYEPMQASDLESKSNT